MGNSNEVRDGEAEFREPFRLLKVEESGESHLSPAPKPGDSWDDDVRHRVAEFFRILDQWDRKLVAQAQRRAAA